MPAAATPTLHELAEGRDLREILKWFTRERLWVNDIHQQLCRVPAPTFLEQQRAEWFVSQFRSYGCTARLDRAGNVLATLAPTSEPPYLLVTAHLDTVLAPKTKEEIRIDSDGKLRGPGVSDNGCGLAALLAIARAIKLHVRGASPWDGVMFAANVGEEGEGNLSGMRHLCKAIPGAALLILDGASTEHVTTEALGSRRYEVIFTGPGGHSWSDYGTANPIHALARTIALFTETRLPARTTLNVGMIEGGSGVNVIATQARAKVDIRSEQNGPMETLVQSLTEAVERAQEQENTRATLGKVAARLKEIGSRPAGRLLASSPLLAALRQVDAHLGLRTRQECASTDANIPLSLGMDAISIGAGGQGGGAHTPAEWFSPEGRDLGLKRIVLTMALLLRDSEAAA
jgi:tripeptide aminopeptidase